MTNKWWATVFLLLLLVIFPILSWFFLKDGLTYRIQAKEALIPKALIPKTSLLFSEATFQVWYQDSLHFYQSRIKELSKLFADRSDVINFMALDSMESIEVHDSLQKAWEASGHPGIFDNAAFLLDTVSRVLRSYSIPNDEEMAKLAQHIVYLLPPEKKKDFRIRQKRDNQE